MRTGGQRSGVVVVGDAGSGAFVARLIEEAGGAAGELVEASAGRSCLAALNLPVRRRLLVLDGEPSDRSAGALIEAAQLVDRDLPALLVRRGWSGPATRQGAVHILPGPIDSPACASLLRRLLAAVAQ